MKEWFSPAEIAAALGVTVRATNKRAIKERWRRGDMGRRGRGGGWEYHISLLPETVQARLALVQGDEDHSATRCAHARDEGSGELWDRFEQLSKAHKAVCERRLKVILEAERLARAGLGETAAVRRAARGAQVSAATVFNWKARLRGLSRKDWLAALAPEHKGSTARAECHASAYAILKSDYLRPERPSFSACYRRMVQAAEREGWSPIPSERTLRRHLDADVPKNVQSLAREGRDKAKTFYPAQRRSRGHFHAMQAVNMDGHKLDVFVRFDDGRIARVHLIALQDLYSGKIVAWRMAESENKESVRLVIGDMVERYGIPDKIWLDNGRAFASKWISGGTANRYRFKVREEDPQGLLTALGVEICWTTPYSGQSKPIERAFRDLAEEIARHPFCAGAYTGNRPDAKPENYGNAAVPLDEFRKHVAARIAEHNGRQGRRTETAMGRSFDQTFEASLAEPATIVRWPTAAQKALWLMAAERVRAKKGSGEIELLGNRYWAAPLCAHAGRNVTVRFDPDDLAQPVRVYDAQDRLICEAALVGDVRFDSAGEAREHARKRNAMMKLLREQKRLHAELSAEELARIFSGGDTPEPAPVRPAIPRIVTGRPVPGSGAAAAIRQEEIDPDADPEWDDRMEQNFSRALRLIAGRDLEG